MLAEYDKECLRWSKRFWLSIFPLNLISSMKSYNDEYIEYKSAVFRYFQFLLISTFLSSISEIYSAYYKYAIRKRFKQMERPSATIGSIKCERVSAWNRTSMGWVSSAATIKNVQRASPNLSITNWWVFQQNILVLIWREELFFLQPHQITEKTTAYPTCFTKTRLFFMLQIHVIGVAPMYGNG